ncbi:hypothetical protein [Microbacterium sp. 77mftsu3.1]|uniref:hypothetical protein n=1 Tax=Microbacterium sp. 77mftsu3.1 TaxID=1761802 RepID=UPI00036D51C0|nr:hypothetical protein [Microbacterium sp. 77mftsu3.1]SDH56058.1 hypothetical protein SAMN04488590_3579 [Microbacterium sp. 77mftsu3.1]
MANPFLVLGGIAVGIITAAFGVLAVPGWVAAAQDASATNDLASIALAQSAAASSRGSYTLLTELRTGWADGKDAGTRVTTASPAVHVAANAKGDKWAAVAISDSGHVLVRTWASPNVLRGATPLAAAASTPLNGAVIPTGLPAGVGLSGTRATPVISLSGAGEGIMPENAVIDPSFLDASAWPSRAGHTIVPEGAHGDGASLRVTNVSSSANRMPVLTRTGLTTPVVAGDTWRVSGRYKTTADWNGTGGWAKLRAYDASGGANAPLGVAWPKQSNGDWELATAEFTIPAGVAAIGLDICSDNTVGSIWWDDIHLEKVSG